MRGINVRCPECRIYFNEKHRKCTRCGKSVSTFKPMTYVVVWHNPEGRKRRKFIKNSRPAAVNFLMTVYKDITEGKYIDRDPGEMVTLGELIDWYLKLPETKNKRSYGDTVTCLNNIKARINIGMKANQLNRGVITSYQANRLQEKSSARKGQTVAPNTVNNEIRSLKAAYNRAVEHGKIRENPIAGVKMLKVERELNNHITPEEFHRLLEVTAEIYKPVVMLAYLTGMRQMEILEMTWREVDLKKREINLPAHRTKTNQARSVPWDWDQRLINLFEGMQRGLPDAYVFTKKNGKPIARQEGFRYFDRARRAIGRSDFRFHSLRHVADNNFTKAGLRPKLVMDIMGHKSMGMHLHYQGITDEERHDIKHFMNNGKRHLEGHIDKSDDLSR